MKSNSRTTQIIFISSAIGIAALSRLVPHLPNFTPVAAMALFGGAYIQNKKLAFLIPFAALLLSDLVLGFSLSTLPVYMCFAFTVAIGLAIRTKVSVVSVGLGAVLSSLVFFLITNLPIWYSSLSLYPLTVAGTLQSYTAALPFLTNSLAGDLFYSALLFSIYGVAQKNIPALAKVQA
jgi:hypothetical protein